MASPIQAATPDTNTAKATGPSKKRATKRKVTSPATVPEEGAPPALLAATKRQEKRLQVLELEQDVSNKNVEVDNKIKELTLGWGIIHLIDKALQTTLKIEAPALTTQVWNTRAATTKSVRDLWAKMNKGEALSRISIEHAVIVGIQNKAMLKAGWNGPWNQPVEWCDPLDLEMALLLIQGNHRLEIMRQHALADCLKELKKHIAKGDDAKAEAVRKEMWEKTKWVAQIIDLDALENTVEEPLRSQIKDKLAKNVVTFKKPDSLFETISNMGSWLLTMPDSAIGERLHQAITDISQSNKGQRAILSDKVLVRSLCMLTQIEYFRIHGQFKVDDLNTSRTYAAQMVMPMAKYFSRFYLSLTIPGAVKKQAKVDLYTAVYGLDIFDKRFNPGLLNMEFFSGLDDLFMQHLFPSFQSFGLEDGIDMAYDQNKAPSMDDDDDEENQIDSSPELVSLNWSEQFRKKYTPAVQSFVKEWVDSRRTQVTDANELKALGLLQAKVMHQLMIERDESAQLPGLVWHDDPLGLPLLTPSFMNALLGSLNDVEDATIALLTLLEPMAWSYIKQTRGDNSKNCVGVLKSWLKYNMPDEKITDALEKVTLIFLASRHTGLAKLATYLKKNKLEALDKKSLHNKYKYKDSHGAIDTNTDNKEIDNFNELEKDCFALNNFMWKTREVMIKGKVLKTAYLEDYIAEADDKGKAEAIGHMIISSVHQCGNWKKGTWSKVGAKDSAKLLEAYSRAQHVWECLEIHPEAKKVWMDIQDVLTRLNETCHIWPEKASWRFDESLEIVLEEDEALSHLAPLQQAVAADMAESVQKEMVTRMNRILEDVCYISVIEHEEEAKLPEEVLQHLTRLIQQLGYCALSKSNKFKSKKELKAVDMMTSDQIYNKMKDAGVKSDVLGLQVLSKMAWKQGIVPPKGKELDHEVKKRARVTCETEKPRKRRKTESKKAKSDEDEEEEEEEEKEEEEEEKMTSSSSDSKGKEKEDSMEVDQDSLELEPTCAQRPATAGPSKVYSVQLTEDDLVNIDNDDITDFSE